MEDWEWAICSNLARQMDSKGIKFYGYFATPSVGRIEDAKVAKLMNDGGNQWNARLIDVIFLSRRSQNHQSYPH